MHEQGIISHAGKKEASFFQNSVWSTENITSPSQSQQMNHHNQKNVSENNSIAQRLLKEVFDNGIKLKKVPKNKIKKKSILQQTMMMTIMKNWKMLRMMKNIDNDETFATSRFEN